MAVFSGVIRSAALHMDTHLSVALPFDYPAKDDTPCKVLYLFHGIKQGSEAWLYRSCIERLAWERGAALVMPEVQRSFYTDMHTGSQYFTYVSQELPELCSQMFNISTQRKDTFVAGLSMGGYGALLCAFSHPDRYAAAASFSGALDLRHIVDNMLSEYNRQEMRSVLGLGMEIPEKNDLFGLAEKAADNCPRILITCGEQDDLLHMSSHMHEHLDSLSVEHQYSTWPGGHDWAFWDKSAALALDYFLPQP